MALLKVGVLISGSGTNLQALIDACADPEFPAEIALVISNRPDAKGMERAAKADVPVRLIDHKQYKDRESFDAALDAALRDAGVEFVCLAGFMRLLTTEFVNRWRDRLINIHPSLLPSFKGLHAADQAVAAGVRIAGCTVHFVRPEMDSGPIIVQAAVPLLSSDTADSLQARIQTVEHRCYPLALRLVAEGKVEVDGERVRIHDDGGAETRLVSPPE